MLNVFHILTVLKSSGILPPSWREQLKARRAELAQEAAKNVAQGHHCGSLCGSARCLENLSGKVRHPDVGRY